MTRWAVVGYAIALLAIVPWFHPVPCDVSAESDGYLLGIEQVLAGELPIRVFQPLLYIGVGSLFAMIFGDPFVGARTLSILCAAISLWCTYDLMRRTDRRAAIWAMLFLGSNPVFLHAAVSAASDAMFVALLLAALALLARWHRTPSRAGLIGIGLLVGCAWSTRYLGALLVVPVVLVVGLRWRPLAWIALSAGIAALPQCAANVVHFGSPFYNETWRNLAVKLAGAGPAMLAGPFDHADGWWNAIAARPGEFVVGAIRELGRVATDSLPRVLAAGPVGFGLAVLWVAGLLTAMRSRVERAWTIFALAYVGVLCTAFFGLVRLTFPIAPLVLLTGLAWWCGRAGRWAGPVLAVCFLWSAISSVSTHRWFQSLHTPGLFAASAWMAEHVDDATVVVGDNPILPAFVRYSYVQENLAVLGYQNGATHDLYLEALRPTLEHYGATHYLATERYSGPRPPGLARGEGVPEYLEIVFQTDGAVLYRYVP